ncbi:hypothetical protein [Halocatena marina]|uniref:Uncharacterized protein n=1 Tax=Halocatena marina TaxID=2934937 RepID=A0ABD5YUN7_9EURY|nr:hypothetical protein [Halocatena marina]
MPKETSQKLIELAVELHQWVAPFHTRSIYLPEEWYSFQVRRASICEELGWLTIFSEACLVKIGRETILSAPARRVEELETSDVLLVITKLGDAVDDVDKVVEAVRTHLNQQSRVRYRNPTSLRREPLI